MNKRFSADGHGKKSGNNFPAIAWLAVLLPLLIFDLGPQGLSSPSALAEATATRIIETVPLNRDNCTIEILSEDLLLCQGDEITVSAELECEPGYQQGVDPQWYLDDEPLGEGFEIALSPEPGEYVLTVTCASCEDQILVTMRTEEECNITPLLDALYAVDEVEVTEGIFLSPSGIVVSAQTFSFARYGMRPFTLDAPEGLDTGDFRLAVEDADLEVYRLNGTKLNLPVDLPVVSFPETFLINAISPSEGRLVATYVTPPGRELGEDEIRVRIGALPGLAGGSLDSYPWFEFVSAVNDDDLLEGALDPGRHVERAGLSYRAYVVPHRTPIQWASDNSLTDVSGGFETDVVQPGSIADNILALWTSGLDAGDVLGKPYDVVYDFGLDGFLDPGDMIDGLNTTEAGVYLVRDLTDPGPYDTTEITYSGGSWLGQDLYYPTNIAAMGELPLVIISHGNGHVYTWYDYLGEHLASYGYVVMSHQNNTGPGIQAASTTTLTNTDYILGHLGSIGGGVLDGHVDGHHITWIGHSRGGEGVVLAYDRIYDGSWRPDNFTVDDIHLISSIAPTVFLGTTSTNPHEVIYHMLYGAADGDVHGGASLALGQAMRLAEAARGTVQVNYVQGASHNDFNCCGFNDGTGPDQIGRAEAQRVSKSYYLALIEHYIMGNVPARDYLTRNYHGFRPSGIADHVVCANTYRDALDEARFVIDDHQTNTDPGLSSSGGAVSYDVNNIHEATMDDGNTTFTWTTSDKMNGMTRASSGDGYRGGIVFDWSSGQSRFYEIAIPVDERDFQDDLYLSFRACQGTRHPETVGLDELLSFTVTLRDGDGTTSSIDFEAYGGISTPYKRSGQGSGYGWANEFNTVRIRLADFENDGSGLDLGNIAALRLEFGTPYGSDRGRIGIDDIELTTH